MAKTQTYNNFPIGIPIFAIILSYFTYLVGAYIIAGFGLIFAFLYLFYCFGVELLIILRSCKDCYYYGKICGLGKGWVAPWFCKKGNPEKFAGRIISFYDLVPDFLVVIFPVVSGIILLALNFSFLTLSLLIILIILFFGGTAIIRGKLVCKYCKQREIGCPAEKLFNKK
jgi:hypothetical protein